MTGFRHWVAIAVFLVPAAALGGKQETYSAMEGDAVSTSAAAPSRAQAPENVVNAAPSVAPAKRSPVAPARAPLSR